MKVNYNNSRDITFNGFWNSKCVKKGLEFASNNGALFAATTTLALSTGVRTASILVTPKTEKENKKIACAKSVISGILEFALTLAISMPIAAAFKKIDANPAKYLKQESINALKGGFDNLKESKAYSLATQLFKLGLGFAVVLPKALLTAAGIPIVMDKFSNKDDKVTKLKKEESKGLSFEGKGNEPLTKGLAKILDNKFLQEFSREYKDSNFPMHIFALKDVFATASFVALANKNKKINDEQKPFLIKNSIISTALSLISSYTIDKLTEKQAAKILEKIKAQNVNDPKLAKYLEGFKIVKPIVILAVVYYTIIPVLSTFLAQISENVAKKQAD